MEVLAVLYLPTSRHTGTYSKMTQNDRYKNGSIELKGTTWYLRYSGGPGKPRPRERIGTIKDFPTKSAATRAAVGIRERINKQGSVTAPKTMGDVIARYLSEELPSRPSTAKNYRHYIRNHIDPKWGGQLLTDIKAHEVRTWIRGIDLGDKSKSHVHGLMRILFRFAMLWDWYPTVINPMKLFKLENATRRVKKPRVLSPGEFGRLLGKLKEPYRSMATICGCLGLRCSELVGLKWKDVDWDAKTVTIARAAVGRHIGEVKTYQSAKSIPLAEELVQLFVTLRQDATGADGEVWIFPSPQQSGKRPYNAYGLQRYRITPAAIEAGLGDGVGWHTLRHSYRSWLNRLGAPIGVQKDLMRHADIRTTMNIYGDSFTDDMRNAQHELARLVMQ